MQNNSILLIADPAQESLIQSLCSRLSVVGIVNPTRKRFKNISLPVAHSVENILDQVKPDVCCFLTPYSGLIEDFQAGIQSGCSIICAGPVPSNRKQINTLYSEAETHRVSLYFGGIYPYSPVFSTLLNQSQQEDFGQGVFLRLVSGGGHTLLSAWWAVCEAINLCEPLLGSKIKDIRIAAAKAKSTYHINATLSMHNRSNAQLTITPIPLDTEKDVILLGSGGLLYYDSLVNTTGIMTKQGFKTYERDIAATTVAWIDHSLNRTDQHLPSEPLLQILQQESILRAIRAASQKKDIIKIEWSAT